MGYPLLISAGYAALLVAFGAYLVAAWRPLPQRPPELSHTGIRWTLHHTRLGLRSIVLAFGVLAVVGSGWLTIGSIFTSLVANVPPSRLGTGGPPSDPLLLVAGWMFGIAAAPVLARRSWTRLTADPTEIRLERPWPWGRLVLRWSDVERIEVQRGDLVLRAAGREIRLEAPCATEADLDAVSAWLRAGAEAQPAAPPLPAPPPPIELHALRAGLSAASARAARRTRAE